MKKLFFLFFLIIPSIIFAQTVGSLTVFSENGDKFYLFLDGIKQNNDAQSNIRIQELPDLYYSAKIIFKDSTIEPVSKSNLYISDGDDILQDATYRIRREKGAKAKLGFYSMKPVQQHFIPPAGTYVYHFGQPVSAEVVTLIEKKEASPEIVTSTQSLGNLTVFSPNGDKFFIYLNGIKQNDEARSDIRIQKLPDLFYNAKIVFKDAKLAPIVKNNLFISDEEDNMMDAAYRIRRDKTGKPRLNFFSMRPVKIDFIPAPGLYVYNFRNPATEVINTPAPKVIPSTSDSIINIAKSDPVSTKKQSEKVIAPNNATNKPVEKNKPANKQAVAKNQPIKTTETVVAPAVNANNTPVEYKKCNGWPMGKADLAAAKKQIEATVIEESRLSLAQEIISSNCLLVSQVTEFCDLLVSEKSKLAFAKFAYEFTIDKKNYSAIFKLLKSASSQQELTRFINGG